MATKPRQPDPCPRCYLGDNGRLEPLLSPQAGGGEYYSCRRGHSYPDHEELIGLLKEVYGKVQAAKPAAPQPVTPPKPAVPEPVVDKTVIQDPGSDDKSIFVNPADLMKLTTLLGNEFSDSSSLVGAVYSLNQQLLDAQEIIRGHNKIRGNGGDEAVNLIIPERHVEPMRDIAESNSMSLERYMNAMVEHGLDSGWFS